MTDQVDEQRRLLSSALERSGLSLEQLWMRYFALGGDVGEMEVEAYLNGLMELPSLQRDVLALTVNERLDELTSTRVPYSRPVRDILPLDGPLAALVELLDGMHLAPPERLSAITAAAGRLLDLRISIYLVDYDQRKLMPVPGPVPDDEAVPLGVDSTLPGRAFREVRMVPSEGGGSPRLWVPLLDGVERLGVLKVSLTGEMDVHDERVRTQCRWLAALIGHLVTIVNNYGDGLDRRRLHRSRSAAGELIWNLLPPLTAGTDTFALAGLSEPCYDVGGDAFDYSLSEKTASLAIFDAVGHDLRSGFIAGAVLAAYRSARRGGSGLFEQARVIDETIVGQFGVGMSATGVLAELDLRTGRLRYLVAGHPRPLVLRSGKVVKTLDGGLRPPFGLGDGELTIAEEMLQPGDWLVLHTDGITEARDPAGAFFGDERLVDFLEREAASGHPPPETVRRLVHAVLKYQNGVLQDDATVVLARWIAEDDLMP
jgi:stage II sporulation SpoE-like protein